MSAAAIPVPRGEASSSAYAYGALVHAISTCRLAPGTPIRERSDAARLGMSRTPFREALHRLELDGLVIRRAKRGTLVAPLDAREIRDAMGLREAIEVGMAQRLIAAGVEDFEPLEELLARQRSAARRGDWRAFLEADEGFHLLIVKMAGNALALEAVRRTWMHVNRARYLAPPDAGGMAALLQDHEQVLAALRSGDVDGVRWALRRHLEEPVDQLLDQVQTRHPEAFRG